MLQIYTHGNSVSLPLRNKSTHDKMENSDLINNKSINRIKQKMREKRMRQKRIASTSFESSMNRSKRFNRSFRSNTLYLNNKQLTASLESVRKVMRTTQCANLELLKERQALYERINHLQHIADKKTDQMDVEISACVQVRMQSIKELLNKTSYSLLGTVDTIQEALQICDQVPDSLSRRSGSIRSVLLSSSDEESIRNSLPGNNRPTIYFKKPVGPSTSIAGALQKCAENISSEVANLSSVLPTDDVPSKSSISKNPDTPSRNSVPLISQDSNSPLSTKTNASQQQALESEHKSRRSICCENEKTSPAVQNHELPGQSASNSRRKTVAHDGKDKSKVAKRDRKSASSQRNEKKVDIVGEKPKAKSPPPSSSSSSEPTSPSQSEMETNNQSRKTKGRSKSRKSVTRRKNERINAEQSPDMKVDDVTALKPEKKLMNTDGSTDTKEMPNSDDDGNSCLEQVITLEEIKADLNADKSNQDVEEDYTDTLSEELRSEETAKTSSQSESEPESNFAVNGDTRRRSRRLSNLKIQESLLKELEEADIPVFATKPTVVAAKPVRRTVVLNKLDVDIGENDSAKAKRRGTFVVDNQKKTQKDNLRRVTFAKTRETFVLKGVESLIETESSGDDAFITDNRTDSREEKSLQSVLLHQEKDTRKGNNRDGPDGEANQLSEGDDKSRPRSKEKQTAKRRSAFNKVDHHQDKVMDIIYVEEDQVETDCHTSDGGNVKQKTAKQNPKHKEKGQDNGKKSKPTKIPKMKLKQLVADYDEGMKKKPKNAKDKIFDFREDGVTENRVKARKKGKSDKGKKKKSKKFDMSVFELSQGDDFSHPNPIIPRHKHKPVVSDALPTKEVQEVRGHPGIVDMEIYTQEAEEKGTLVDTEGKNLDRKERKKKRRLYSETSIYSVDDNDLAGDSVCENSLLKDGHETAPCPTESDSSDKDCSEPAEKGNPKYSIIEKSTDEITKIAETPDEIIVKKRRRRRQTVDLYKVPLHLASDSPTDDNKATAVEDEGKNIGNSDTVTRRVSPSIVRMLDTINGENDCDFSEKQPVFAKPYQRQRKSKERKEGGRAKASTFDSLPSVMPAKKGNSDSTGISIVERKQSPTTSSDKQENDRGIACSTDLPIQTDEQRRDSDTLQKRKRFSARDADSKREQSPVVAKRSKRSASKNICFKEPSLNGKLRRGDAYTLGWGRSGKEQEELSKDS
ncbi:enolase-phosphatase E1-like [Ptychodera flava]|uniref:enolase-phosphatase E1-like n=1 Tax=Ptychodera flava TaxID=63121 RepID=UPI003969E47D